MKKILLAAFILFSSLVNAQNIYLPISYNSTSLDFYSGNLNNLTAIGFYKGRHNVNAPDNGYWYIAVEAYDNTGGNVAGWTKQVATAFGSENIYKPGTTFVRTQVGADGWTPWMMQLQVNADGNVGIGTASPLQKLSVLNPNGYGVAIADNAEVINGISNSGYSRLYLQHTGNNGDLLLVNGGGNVGIGTTSPSAKLEVNGDFKFTSEYNRLAFPVSLGYGGGITGDDGVYKRLTLFHGNSIALETGSNELSASNTRLFINETGNIGIGTSSPAYKLDVNGGMGVAGDIKIGGGTGVVYSDINAYAVFHDGNYLWQNRGNNATRMMLGSNGDLLVYGNQTIGTTAAQKDLNVNGNIKTRKIKVTATGWPDYVFDSSYYLAPLSHVEKFIQENKHLPEVPSAAEVKKDGLDLGDNQAVLLKKIEELTLYIIQQNKQISQQAEKMEQMEKRLAEVETKQSN